MQQLNEKIIVLNPGDEVPQMTGDAIKLYLGGTMDFASSENDWQSKFCEAMVNLTDPLKGLLMYKNTNWIIFNPHVPFQSPAAPNLDNPAFVQTMQWRLSGQDMADIIFLNIMNKSQSPVPILEFGSNLRSGKLIVRCGEMHPMYSQIRMYCEKYNVPLLTGRTSVKDVLLSAGGFLQKFQDLQSNNQNLPL
jgi:hypothetical protein